MKWSDFDRWLKADHLQGNARSLTIDQVVIEDVYSQAEKRLRPAPVLYFKETKKGLVLPGTEPGRAAGALRGRRDGLLRQAGAARADAYPRRRPGVGRDPAEGRAGG